MRIDPRDRRVLYAFSGSFPAKGLLRSQDQGSTWSTVQQGFDGLWITSLAAGSIPGKLYAIQAYGSVWKSEDSGQSWAELASTASLKPSILAADPFFSTHLLLATQQGLRVSQDAGASWEPPRQDLPAAVSGVAFYPYLILDVVLVGQDSSVYTSGDGGTTWQRGGDLFPNCRFCLAVPPRIAFDPQTPHHFFVVADGQLLESRDGAAHWTALPGAGSQVQVAAMGPFDPRTVYAGGCEGLRKSVDGGATWQQSDQGILPPIFGGVPPQPLEFCISELVVDRSDPSTLYADRSGSLSQLYRSTDAGATWTLLDAGFSRHLDDTLLVSLIPDPSSTDRLYAATNSYGVVSGRFAGATPLHLGAPAGDPATSRFTVKAAWFARPGQSGPATPVPLTSDSGYFWFFAPGNLELGIKLLDGATVNRHAWTYYASLSSVQYEVTVADETTGAVHSYVTGGFLSVGDVRSLPSIPSTPAAAAATVLASHEIPDIPEPAAAPAVAEPCVAGATSLCLNGGRFRAELSWQNGPAQGEGQAIALTDESGYFWFFGPNLPEVFVKVLDARTFNNHFWVFFGSLSDVHFVLKVQDLTTGAIRTYNNPAGTLASTGDTFAF